MLGLGRWLSADGVAGVCRLYQAVVDDMLERIESTDGIERRGLVLATMTKLKQVCNHPAHFLRDGSALASRLGKLERLDEILDEVLAVGEKALLDPCVDTGRLVDTSTLLGSAETFLLVKRLYRWRIPTYERRPVASDRRSARLD
jgi:hypothetical protein